MTQKPITQVARDMLAHMKPEHKCEACPHYFTAEEMVGLCEAVIESEKFIKCFLHLAFTEEWMVLHGEIKEWLAKYAVEHGETV